MQGCVLYIIIRQFLFGDLKSEYFTLYIFSPYGVIHTKRVMLQKAQNERLGLMLQKFISVKYHLLFCNFNYLYIEAMQKYD
ncbi:hypothetical protein Sjap_004367 [Stephania japonica]|uniref:Uncharacterized protein n=1 Tax=Stephania japonica TaxID=461633 RepID=A0AAP0K351_9MAGN